MPDTDLGCLNMKKISSYSLILFSFIFCAALFSSSCEDEVIKQEITVNLDSNSLHFSAEGGENIVSIEIKDSDFSVEVIDGKDWLSAEKLGNDKILLKATENLTTEIRTGKIKVVATNNNAKTYIEYTITQEAAKTATG